MRFTPSRVIGPSTGSFQIADRTRRPCQSTVRGVATLTDTIRASGEPVTSRILVATAGDGVPEQQADSRPPIETVAAGGTSRRLNRRPSSVIWQEARAGRIRTHGQQGAIEW